MVSETLRIAVVIPCFRVRQHILSVIASIPPLVSAVIVVDDACPDHSGDYVREQCKDARVTVLYNEVNQGVGGAVVHGYKYAIEQGYDIVVKIDGDGQMDGALIPVFITPIVHGYADYTKGNRFFYPESVHNMPVKRLVANIILSFITKLSSGYWNSFDPTNGFTAISVPVLRRLPLDKLSKRYFFESDILFRLNTIRAVLQDIPMDAHYASEVSNLRIMDNIFPFLVGNIRNTCKRITYNHYLRNFSLASLQLIIGAPLMIFGVCFGAYHWIVSAASNEPATAGTVMLAALPIIIGLQLMLSFLNYDINSVPRQPISGSLR